MNDATQNASVARTRPGLNSEPTTSFTGAGANTVDSGRNRHISGTSTSAGSAPMTNSTRHPSDGITAMPSSAVATAPTW